MSDLNIAEIPYETGEIRYRYSRYLAPDRSRWIRHGLFCAYHKNGQLASEGNYVDGFEDGLWRDFHENGKPAAEGRYYKGQEAGEWRFWNSDGSLSTERNLERN
jgi:antitoxin component YwqK of YwqJK toxin-antitoxin module